MTPNDAALLVFGFLGLLVGLRVGLGAAERRSPRFSRWLDKHWPEPAWSVWDER